MYSQSTAKIPIGDPKQKSINNDIVFPRLQALDEENKNLKSDLTVAETKIELLELENESITSQLNITDLEIRNLQDKYDLLSSQNKIFASSIETIEARLDILEKNSGMAFTKVKCIFPMVIWSELRKGQYRNGDHRKNALHFTMLSLTISRTFIGYKGVPHYSDPLGHTLAHIGCQPHSNLVTRMWDPRIAPDALGPMKALQMKLTNSETQWAN